ncbi:MAG: penicillin-binding transpeptidase domain-containing protein [bacterium]|nr:penicillin-binding transpeptidase domain-containing protein [bacterium]
MFSSIKGFLQQIFKSRIVYLVVLFVAMSSILLFRLFQLQIVNGANAQSKYITKVVKKRTLKSTRGNIYDRDGKLLAYNELAYGITIEDNGTYIGGNGKSSTQVKNESINEDIAMILHEMDRNGDVIDNDFSIALTADNQYEFTISGTRLMRFRADIYGLASIEDLGYNEKLHYDTANASAEQIMEYLGSDRASCFDISEEYSKRDYYRIAIIRYKMRQNSYQKYISATIASDVSEETVAYVSEHLDELQGVAVTEDTIRRYNDSKYFAHLIGYTGQIDEEEYFSFGGGEEGSEYSLTDTVGKSGIEQYMDTELKGKKGEESIYVDNLGKELETIERTEPIAGNDVYLSISMDLQEAVYDLLEQEIAGIVYSKIINAKEYQFAGSSDIKIPIDDVYFALINNNIIKMDHFSAEDASSTEREVFRAFKERQKQVLREIKQEFTTATPKAYENLSEDMQVYMSFIVSMLMDEEIIETSKIDWNDETYLAWKNDQISLQEYLYHVINEQWFDITKFPANSKYSDSQELYDVLVDYIMNQLKDNSGFSKRIYKYMLRDDFITGKQICLILYDQNILDYDDEMIARLTSGVIQPFDFMMSKIKNLEITPAQLALDPCTGSCVISDVTTGELLACVTYPGYDNNRLANMVDSEYFASLMSDLSSPFYNNATQQKTAPGSTFKMVTATAGLSEGVIDIHTLIEDKGRFERVENGPKCWIYPNSTHGDINVSEALRDSCNYFFYEVGWELSQVGDSYVESAGIEKLAKYAKLYGLGDVTGIETVESKPEIADKYPITAAIGQSNHNYTTIAISRYVTAVANRGTVYNYTLLNKLTDASGNVLETYAPTVKYKMTEIPRSTWNAIHEGNRMVVENLDAFDDFGELKVAGKTGTAQQIATRPNHALFVGYAPYQNPKYSIATRIAYGYTSHNAADVSARILKYIFRLEDREDLLTGTIVNVENASNGFND